MNVYTHTHTHTHDLQKYLHRCIKVTPLLPNMAAAVLCKVHSSKHRWKALPFHQHRRTKKKKKDFCYMQLAFKYLLVFGGIHLTLFFFSPPPPFRPYWKATVLQQLKLHHNRELTWFITSARICHFIARVKRAVRYTNPGLSSCLDKDLFRKSRHSAFLPEVFICTWTPISTSVVCSICLSHFCFIFQKKKTRKKQCRFVWPINISRQAAEQTSFPGLEVDQWGKSSCSIRSCLHQVSMVILCK